MQSVTIKLPDALAAELHTAATSCQIRPTEFAAQCVEATLAQRRLDKLPPAPLGARCKDGEVL